MSVDAFLERRSEFVTVGKAAIARQLIGYEQQGLLRPHAGLRKTISHVYSYEWSPPRWYGLLFNFLTSDPRSEVFHENKLSILTFNYDRSLEQFLYTGLLNTYGTSETEALELLATIDIVHVYGLLAPFDPTDREGRAYTPHSAHDKLTLAAEHISIIHEDRDDSETLTQARDLIQNAKRVCFLGFGYHPTNVRRLGIKKDRKVEGTVFGMTDQEIRHLVAKPFRNHISTEEWRLDGTRNRPPVAKCTNLDFLRHYFPLGSPAA